LNKSGNCHSLYTVIPACPESVLEERREEIEERREKVE